MSLDEVAKLARVSTATVSRVINDSPAVKASTRTRVLKVIADLNYYPNLHARTLAARKSRTLGMIVSNLRNPFFLDVFQQIDLLANESGYEVLVANTDYKPQRLVTSVRSMIGRRVAGLAVIVSEMEPALIDELLRSPVPVVFYDVGIAGRNITNIRVNYRKGIEKAAGYLHDLGHRRIGFVGHHAALGPIHARVQSLLEVAPRFSPRLEIVHTAAADSLEGGRTAARDLLNSGFKPTAIMCVNDLMALGVVRELRERGLRVPDDVSVTGFDNISLAEFCSPSLTTIQIPRDQIGRLAFESLLASHEDQPIEGRELLIDPEFVVRDSTARARTAGRVSMSA
ncbi:MAG TPA: LacI family DNA-binding transcriptional regulator [Bryobacteraceae bacterium]|nr:LacI family DNA-binding transcriptional regulator [Bryobacteraceae bacterium]